MFQLLGALISGLSDRVEVGVLAVVGNIGGIRVLLLNENQILVWLSRGRVKGSGQKTAKRAS